MDNRDWVSKERALMVEAIAVPKEVRYKLIDMGYYNDAIIVLKLKRESI